MSYWERAGRLLYYPVSAGPFLMGSLKMDSTVRQLAGPRCTLAAVRGRDGRWGRFHRWGASSFAATSRKRDAAL
jgi:hypothetical protein